METQLKKGKSAIYSSLLKYGCSNFSFEILEYCEPSDAICREQYYLDLLKGGPKYNILPTAGSSKGFKHSEETLIQMIERKHTEEAKALISEALKGKNHPFFGKTHSEESRLKMSFAAPPDKQFGGDLKRGGFCPHQVQIEGGAKAPL